MFNPRTELLIHFVPARAAEIAADPAPPGPWEALAAALEPYRADQPDLAAVIDGRDLAGLKTIVAAWADGSRGMPEHDKDLLKRAMRAFRKRLNLTVLDAESSTGGGPLSGGRASGITGVRAPHEFPREIWLELSRQKRLVNAGNNVFELPPGVS